MATFSANPDGEDEPWIEQQAIENYGFRIWHLIFFCVSGFVSLLVLIFCCIKVRIPRTKQEIEADYRRKKLAKKFKERLRLIRNQDMDAIDLQRALEIIQEDYKNLRRDIDQQVASDTYFHDLDRGDECNMRAEPQLPPSITQKLTSMVKSTKTKSQSSQ